MIGNKLKELRKAKSITQSELAKLLHTNQTMIHRYESDKQDMTISRLFEIAKALNVKPSELLD